MFEPIDYENIKLKEVATDILTTPFLMPEFCEILLQCATEFKEWENSASQIHVTHNLHLEKEQPGFYDIINEGLEQYIWPRLYKWWSTDPIQSKSIFIVKYSEDTQKDLSLHHDNSYISASIKLNSNYDGGTLYFPHQRYDVEEVPVGSLIIWPSQITHLHGAKKLIRGTKYSMTIWTERCLELLKMH
jgi:hypothetical protein